MSELVPALKDTLFSPTYEIVAEYAEIGIDALLDNEVLKGIPVVSTLSSICKIGYNLHERNLIKQTLAFITEFNSGSISQGKLNEHREKLEANPKEAEKELGRVLIILGNQVEQIQSQVLGSFYAAYVKGAISWEKFCELSEANRRSTRAPIAQTQVVALGKIRQIDRYLIRRVLYMLAQICHQLRRFREQAADGVGGRRTDGVILIVGLLPAGSLCHPALRAQVMLRGPQHPAVEQVILRHVQPPGHGFFPPGHDVGKLHLFLGPAHPSRHRGEAAQ